MYKKYTDELSPEEKALLQEAQTSQGDAQGLGSILGGVAGGGLGLLAGLFTGGAALPLATTGWGFGQQVGGGLGGLIGGQKAKSAAERAGLLRKERLSSQLKEQSDRETVAQLLGPWLGTRGL